MNSDANFSGPYPGHDSEQIPQSDSFVELLRESEKRFRTVADFTYDWEYWIDPEGKLRYCSPSCERITGHQQADFYQNPELLHTIIHPGDSKRIMKHFRGEMDETITSVINFRIITKTGETRYLGHVCQPVYDEDGKCMGRRVSNRDITEEKLTEKMLEVQRNLAVQLSSTFNLRDALDQVLTAALQINTVDSASIFIVDPFSGSIEMKADKGLLREYVAAFSSIPAGSQMAQLIFEKKPVYLGYGETLSIIYPGGVAGSVPLPRQDVSLALESESPRAMAIIPVPHMDQIVAALHVLSHTHKEIPLPSRMILEAISLQIGGVIARMQAESALREHQGNMQTLIHSLEDYLLILDAQGRILYFNPSMQKCLGYSTEQLMAKSIGDIYPPYWQDRSAALLADMLSGKVAITSISLMAKNGSLIPVETNITRGQWGDREALFLISHDLRHRKRFETLEESEARYRSVVEDQTELICRFSRDGVLSFVNDAFSSFFAKTRDELLGHSLLPYIPDRYRSAIDSSLVTLSKENPVLISEQQLVLPDSRRIWQQWVYRAIYDPKDRLLEYQAVARDITDLKRVEDALKKSEIRFRAAAEGSLDAFYILECCRDAAGNIIDFIVVDMNTRAENQLSISKHNLIGKKIGDVFPVFRSELFNKYIQVVETRQILEEENFIPETQAGSRWYYQQIVPLADGVAVTSRNITRYKEVEESLITTQGEFRKRSATLERCCHGISLLNEMDTRIQGCTTLGDVSEVFKEYASTIFQGWHGAWYLLDDSHNFFEIRDAWGEDLPHQPVFDPDTCRAIRRRQVNVVDNPLSQFACYHVPSADETHPFTPYICVPMMAMEGYLGLLFLMGKPGDTASIIDGMEETRLLAVAAADRLALAVTLVRMGEKLKAQSIYDALTGLYNAQYMKKSLERELHRAGRTHRSVGVIVLDVDHFKELNANHGRDAGDNLLIQIGNFIKSSVRKEDLVCRSSGDGFTIVVYESPLAETLKRAEQIREKVKGLKIAFALDKVLESVTISMGVACYPEHGETAEILFQSADSALYRAKEQGRDRVAVVG